MLDSTNKVVASMDLQAGGALGQVGNSMQEANTKDVSERQMQSPLGACYNMPDADLGPEGFLEEGTSELIIPVAKR